jgi:predicted deacylase
LQDTPEAQQFLNNYTVYILPMANMDGVAHGLTRFNMNGMDLNRNLEKPADPVLSPENAAMEQWLEKMIANGQKPDLAIDFHNDNNGNLNLSSSGMKSEIYAANMSQLENLLRTATWFTEDLSYNGTTTFEEGLYTRYGITGIVYELNAFWVKGLNKNPLAADWLLLGKQLCKVFNEYFKQEKK